MDIEKYILETATSIAVHYSQKGIDFTLDKAKELINNISKGDPSVASQINIDEMADKIVGFSGQVGQVAHNEETLARFLEVPVADLSTLDHGEIDHNIIFHHVKLEDEFKTWLTNWRYRVKPGQVLVGLHDIEYTPDVYGTLNTLHGEFEICINFVCDRPPSEDRVFALLGKIEAYAERKASFSKGDIFFIITPHRFTQGSLNAMFLQNEQEAYSVIPLDGSDIHVLENTLDEETQIRELQDKVRQAEEITKRSKIKRKARDEEEY